MAKSVEIPITAVDKTAPAFKSVNENFEGMSKQIENLEKNLKPFNELLKGGMALGGASAGIGAFISNYTTLTETVQGLSGKLLGISPAAGNAQNALNGLDKELKSYSFISAGTFIMKFSAGALASLQVIKQLAVGWKSLSTIIYVGIAATKAATIASLANQKITVGATMAQTLWAGICGVATMATHGLTAALALNPFTAWMVAITALIGTITALWYWWKKLGTQNQAELMKKEADSALAAADAHKKLREEISESGATDNAKLERLEQLQKKENKSAQESLEARKLARELAREYDGLGISINGTTIELDKNAKAQMQETQAAKRLASLREEYKNLNRAIKSGGLDDEKKEETEKRIKQVNVEMQYYKSGGREDVSGKSEKEIIEMRIEAEKKIEEARQKALEAEKKKLEEANRIQEEGAKIRADLQKTIDDEGKSAREKEIDALKEIAAKRIESARGRNRSGGKPNRTFLLPDLGD